MGSMQNVGRTFRDKNCRLSIAHRGKRILNVRNRINLFEMYLKSKGGGKSKLGDMSSRVIPEEIDRATRRYVFEYVTGLKPGCVTGASVSARQLRLHFACVIC